MATTTNHTGQKLKDQINEQAVNKKAIALIDEYLAKKKTDYLYQRMVRAAYELVSEDSPYVCNKFWLHFILGLEAVMLDPANRRELTSTVYVTDLGLDTGFAALKRFFSEFYNEATEAEMYRIGLSEYADRYKHPDIDAAGVMEAVSKFNPYPSRE